MEHRRVNPVNHFRRWTGALQERDPGLLRLTQALKTVLAVVVSLCIFYRSPTETRLFAAISTAFLMQCTSTGSRRRQQETMLISGLSMILVAGLGSGLFRHPWAQHLLLIVLAFIVFYVMRFLPDQNQFPTFGFILCLLAIHLGGGTAGAGRDVLASGVALPVSFSTFFFLRPPNRLAAFMDATAMFCADAASALHVLLRRDATETAKSLGPIRSGMQRQINFNQQVLDQWPEQDSRPNQINLHEKASDRRDPLTLITDVLLRQYESLQAIEMLEHSLAELNHKTDPAPAGLACGDVVPPELRARLEELLRRLSAGFYSLASRCRHYNDADSNSAKGAEIEEDLLQQSQLQSAALSTRHPLCPEMTHLFTAVVACRELSHNQQRLEENLRELRAAQAKAAA